MGSYRTVAAWTDPGSESTHNSWLLTAGSGISFTWNPDAPGPALVITNTSGGGPGSSGTSFTPTSTLSITVTGGNALLDLSATGIAAGSSYNSLTVDSRGRVTAAQIVPDIDSSGTSYTFTSALSVAGAGLSYTVDLPATVAAGSYVAVSVDQYGRVTGGQTSLSTAFVTGVWTSGVSSGNVQGLGSTWTVSRLSSALSILGNEIWASGFSGSLATISRLSSSVTIMGNEIWSSGLSAKSSIGSFSYISSSRTAMAVEVWSSGLSALGSIVTNSWTSSARTVMGAGLWGSGLSIGNATAGGTLIPAISSMSSKIAALVVKGSSSSFRVFAWTGVQPGDQILVTIQPDTAVSSLSSGLILHSHCTQAGQVELRVSNCSTLVQNQSSKTLYFTRISPF